MQKKREPVLEGVSVLFFREIIIIKMETIDKVWYDDIEKQIDKLFFNLSNLIIYNTGYKDRGTVRNS